MLLAAKILVVILSNSLSLLASAVDSAMDLISVLIIFFTARAAGKLWRSSFSECVLK